MDSNLRTTDLVAQNVYAAGDAVGRTFLASTGVAQGIFATGAAIFELCVDGDNSMTGEWFDPGSLASNPLTLHQAIELGLDAAIRWSSRWAACSRIYRRR